MDTLIAIMALAPVAIAPQAAVDPVAQWHVLVAEAAARFGIPADWIYRVMRAESGGRIMLRGRPITSPKGAMGLMQVMPETYADMARRYALGTDPYLPRDNILAGAAYLRLMYDRFGYPGLFAAYNAGPARYAAFLRTGKGLPVETRTYLAKLGGKARFGAREPLVPASSSPRMSVFFSLNPRTQGVLPAGNSVPDSSLFVPLARQESSPK